MTRLALFADRVPAGLQQGSLTAIERLPALDAAPGMPLAALRQACAQATSAGCDWMIVPAAGETLRADALAIAAPALGYDAIFGAVEVRGSGEQVWRPSRLSFDTAARLPHALLHWWIGTTHLVRVEAAQAVLARLGEGAEALDYLFALWAGHRCIKLAQPLLALDQPPALIDAASREAVLARLDRDPVFLDVAFGAETYRMPYTGRNAGIERDQTRGVFFEAPELQYLLQRVGTGRRIVDVGANTGNHTVFFAGPMGAASVIPFEPLPDVAAILRRSVEENRLGQVDLSRLCIGLSDGEGRAGVVRSERGGLGASRLVDDPAGEILVMRLDDALTDGVDFLKIDVESMEMQVLAGAAATIARDRPLIFIEIANDNTTAFVEWLTRGNYRVERIFSDKGHSNYLIAPNRD